MENEPLTLKIRQTKSGTYYIPSLSIKHLKKLKSKYKKRWKLHQNKSGWVLTLQGE